MNIKNRFLFIVGTLFFGIVMSACSANMIPDSVSLEEVSLQSSDLSDKFITLLDDHFDFTDFSGDLGEVDNYPFNFISENGEIVSGFVIDLSSKTKQLTFDRNLSQFQAFILPSLGWVQSTDEVTDVNIVIGDASSASLIVLLDSGGNLNIETLGFRRDRLGFLIVVMYEPGVTPEKNAIQIARLLDDRALSFFDN